LAEPPPDILPQSVPCLPGYFAQFSCCKIIAAIESPEVACRIVASRNRVPTDAELIEGNLWAEVKTVSSDLAEIVDGHCWVEIRISWSAGRREFPAEPRSSATVFCGRAIPILSPVVRHCFSKRF